MKKTTAAAIGTVAGAIGGLGAIMVTDAILSRRNTNVDVKTEDDISRDASTIKGNGNPSWADADE